MFGNWATGKVVILMAPTITVRIAITIATIGRLMKNFDMSLSLNPSRSELLNMACVRAQGRFTTTVEFAGRKAGDG